MKRRTMYSGYAAVTKEREKPRENKRMDGDVKGKEGFYFKTHQGRGHGHERLAYGLPPASDYALRSTSRFPPLHSRKASFTHP